MKKRNQIPDLELSLCSKCASVYYNDKSYFIERADVNQTVYEECMMCRNPHGFDFNIWNKQLYLDDAIPGYVFRNILREHHDEINITDFVCYKKNDGKEKTECMD